MDAFNTTINHFETFVSNMHSGILSILPGLILVLVSLAIAYLVGFIFRILFKMIGTNNSLSKSNFVKSLKTVGVEPKAHVFLGNVVFWIVFILLLEAVASALGWNMISDKFRKYFDMIPLLIGGVTIVAIGIYVSRIISNLTKAILIKTETKSANILSNIVFYTLMVIIVTIALNFIGISTIIITANVSIILGSVLLAFSISFVFGAKDLLKNILSSSYNKSNYKIGQKVEIEGFRGEIIKITNLSVIVKSASRIRVFPSSRFVDDVVDIVG